MAIKEQCTTFIDGQVDDEPVHFPVSARLLTAGLDFYKPTMSQFAYANEPDAEVTFSFKNRGQQRLREYIDPCLLQGKLDVVAHQGFTAVELDSLAKLTDGRREPLFSADYLRYVADSMLPQVEVIERDDLEISVTGAWPLATFWETVVMSTVNETYFEGYVGTQGMDIKELYLEGDRRLSDKIDYLQAHPDIKIAEFGTRRRFSWHWQQHVVERLKDECPENLLGTSNVALAASEGLEPIGTFAHELPMIYAGLAQARGLDIRASHGRMLDDWYALYGNNLSIGLSDTFGSDFFFKDFGYDRAQKWRGTRHDSGDPIVYGEKVIDFYRQQYIDPAIKVVVFSDGLNIPAVDRIHKQFEGRLGHLFGIGTDLTNDLGLRALNIVMKATAVNGVETVKLSDDSGKHTGSARQIERYRYEFQS